MKCLSCGGFYNPKCAQWPSCTPEPKDNLTLENQLAMMGLLLIIAQVVWPRVIDTEEYIEVRKRITETQRELNDD